MNEEAAVREWTPFAYAIARNYHLPGAERADVQQEALIGVLKGLRCYRSDAGASKRTFVALAVKQHLAGRLEYTCRLKHRTLTNAVRFGVNDEGEAQPILDLLPGGSDTHQQAVDRETLRGGLALLPTLSPIERRAVVGLAVGCTYRELGDPKTIDNAAYRGVTKLRLAA